MDHIWSTAVGVLAANGMTLLFLYGLWCVRDKSGKAPTDLTGPVAILVPLGFFLAGMWLYV